MTTSLVQYVTWSNTAEEVSHTGVLTAETDTHVTILTKMGEMTIPKSDGEFTDATREDFEKSTIIMPVLDPIITVKATGKVSSKGEKVKAFIQTIVDLDAASIIEQIATTFDLAPKTAQIYYYKYK